MQVFALLYQFLGEEPFPHDDEKVAYDEPEFDATLGFDGLHRVYPKVEPRPRDTILPPDLFQRYSQLAFRQDLPNSRAFRIVPEPHPQDKGAIMPKGATGPLGHPTGVLDAPYRAPSG